MSSTHVDDPAEDVAEACPVIDGIEQVGSQWRLAVIYQLQSGEHRFSELERATGASSRTLSRVLEHLQDANLVTRRVEPEAPVATYYSLTEKGEALEPVFEAVEDWADQWLAACQDGT
jgi:DNA-binding HxlR family transcriptional regulator